MQINSHSSARENWAKTGATMNGKLVNRPGFLVTNAPFNNKTELDSTRTSMAYFINIYTKQEKFPSTQANGFSL